MCMYLLLTLLWYYSDYTLVSITSWCQVEYVPHMVTIYVIKFDNIQWNF